MRIIQLVPYYRPAFQYGGPINSVHNLAKGLVAQGKEVHVYTTNLGLKNREDIPIGTEVVIDGVKVIYLPVVGNLFYALSPVLRNFLKKSIRNFNIIHIHGVYQFHSFIGCHYCQKYNIPYVISPRGMLNPSGIYRKSTIKKKIYISMVEKKNIERANLVHCTSKKEYKGLLELGLKPENVEVIPNPVELKDLKTDINCRNFRGKYNLNNNPTIIFLGRLSPIKGLDILISAFKKILMKFPKCQLLLVGPDYKGYQRNIEKLIKESNLENSIKITGLLKGKEKVCALKESDVFILPSYSEGFGMSVVEAMLCGLPVITTKEVGIWEAIEKKGCGLVVNLNPKSIEKGLSRLLENPEERAKFGENGKEIAEKNFSIKKVTNKMLEAYKSVINNNQTSGSIK